MIKAHEIKSMMNLALPLVAALLAQRGMQLIDTIMMGWIGSAALAAGAIGTALFGTISLFCMGILSAMGIFIVHEKGSEKFLEIKNTLQQGIFLALILSIPCMLLIWFIPYFLLNIGEEPIVVKNTVLLVHGMVWGFPGCLLFLVLREFISAFSLTRVVMAVSLCSIPLTFFANTILMYGKYHFPKLGIAGIGYASSIVMWFMCFCLLIYSQKHPLLKAHIGFKPFKIDRFKLIRMLQMGLPSGALFLLEAGLFLSTTIIMGYFGVAALAAHQIALECVHVAYTLPLALSMATALTIGHAVGEKNLLKIKRTALLSFSIVVVIAAIIAVIFMMESHSLIALFLAKTGKHIVQVYPLATSFLHIAALFLCCDAIQCIANAALRGIKDTFIPMLLSVGCYWVLGVGGAYYGAISMHLGVDGIWYGLTLGLCSTAILLTLRFFILMKTMNLSAK